MTAVRERVVLPKDWTFDLAEELTEGLKAEFDPDAAVAELAPKVAGKSLDQATEVAESFFADYGQRWMDRTLELGEEHSDRTYETLKEAAAKTGELAFPFIPERFVEIAYLSTQPIYSLPIVENTRDRFAFKIVFCDTLNALREQCGDELADALPCRAGCLAATKRAFTGHGMEVDVEQESSLAEDEFCQFSVRPRGAAE